MLITWNGKTWNRKYSIYLPKTCETFYVNSATIKKGFLNLKGVLRYNYGVWNNKIIEVPDFSIALVPVVKTKLIKSISL
jgi:hypothetical protein